MPKEEWGTKRLCPHCAARFYDLQRDPMICPSCSAKFTLESLTNARGRSMISDKNASRDQVEEIEDEDLDDSTESSDIDDDLLDDEDDDGDVPLDEIADVAETDEE